MFIVDVSCTQLRAQGTMSRLKEGQLSIVDALCAQLRERLARGCSLERLGELVAWECAMHLGGARGTIQTGKRGPD